MGSSITRHEQPLGRRNEGLITGVTLALAVLIPPAGLVTALAFAISSLRQHARQRAVRYFIIAGIALVIILAVALVELRATTGGGSYVVHGGSSG